MAHPVPVYMEVNPPPGDKYDNVMIMGDINIDTHDIITKPSALLTTLFKLWGECEGDFAVVARRVVASCTATEGGGWVDSEFADLHCFLKRRPHLTRAQV